MSKHVAVLMGGWSRPSEHRSWISCPLKPDHLLVGSTRKADVASEQLASVAKGNIRIEVNQRYTLKTAVQAHIDLESRRTTGSSIFVI